MKLGSVLHFDLSDIGAHNFTFFALDGTSAATFLPKKQKINLPGGISMQWQLDNPDELHCTANAAAFKGCSQQLLPLVLGFEEFDPSAPWQVTEESVAEASARLRKLTGLAWNGARPGALACVTTLARIWRVVERHRRCC